MNTVSFPTFFSALVSNCSYCGAENNGGNFIIRCGKGILACATHKEAAKRDGRAWLHKNGFVLIDDVKDDPVFKALPKNKITVYRSNGTVEHDWRLPIYDDDFSKLMNLLFLDENVWKISLINSSYVLKDIPLEELTLSLCDSQYLLVYDLIERLDLGIYIKEAEEHDKLAKEQSDERPEPSTSPITLLEYLKGPTGPKGPANEF
jgi:hypothetical protein